MNLVIGTPWWLLALLASSLAAAAVEDAIRLRISNVTCLAVLLSAVAAVLIQGFAPVLWQNAVVFILMLASGTLAFGARMLGGGDVKLLAALGLWMSFSGAVWFVVAVCLSGGVLATFFLLTHRMRRGGGGPVQKRASSRIPYGVAIVSGASIAFAAQMGAIGPKPDAPNPLAIRPLSG
jgi:prepilin peptidase CpaA